MSRCTALLVVLLILAVLPSCSDSSSNDDVNKSSKPAHILLITLDTTRQDRIGVYGRRVGGESTTPSIDAVASEGRAYKRAFASTPLTLPSHVTMLTGLEPPQHGVRENNDFHLVGPDDRSFTTLGEDLTESGFATAAFVSARVVSSEFGLAAGFEVYDEVEGLGGGGHSHYEERDAIGTTGPALKWVDALDKNQSFMWVHYFDPHHPYRKHLGRAEAIAAAGDLYDGEISFVDSQVGRLIAAYKEKGIWKDTLVVIVGDHGEGLGEHGEESHGFLLHDATMRVPFVVKPAARLKLAKKRDLVRTIDLAPTIREFAGVGAGMDMPGTSLTATLGEGSVSYGETVYPFRQFGWAALWSIRADNWLMIEGGGRTLLYNHLEDASEMRDLSSINENKRRELSSRLLQERRKLTSRIKSDSRRDPDGMRATAYIGGPSADVSPEPTVDANKKLAHPRDCMVVLGQLNRLIRLLKTMEDGADLGKRQQAFVDIEIVASLLRKDGAGSPSVRFWLARTQWKMGASQFSRDLGKGVQERTLVKGIEDLEVYLKDRALDYRAWNMRLSIYLKLYEITKDKLHLEAIDRLTKEQSGRGLNDGLMHALHGRALTHQKKYKEALAEFEKAVEKAPSNRSFKQDRDEALRRLS